MVNSSRKFALLFALAALLLTGCAGKVRYPDYYTLALAPSKDPPPSETQKVPAVAVQRFESPAYLRQGRIVYRQSPEQIGFYDYHRWASDPGQVVTTAMMLACAPPLFLYGREHDGRRCDLSISRMFRAIGRGRL